jgi:maleate isomerase
VTLETATRSRPVRLGILVIHNDPVPEAELWAHASRRHHTVHTARFWTPRATGVEFTGVGVDALLDETGLADSVEHLRLLGVDAIGYCFASSSVFGGLAFDREFEARVSVRAGCPVVTAGSALREAFGRLDPRDVGFVVPPWFSDGTVSRLLDYLDPRLSLDAVHRFELPVTWAGIERPDLFDRGARHAIDQDEVVRQTLEAFGGRVGTVVIPGSGFASLGAARVLEAEHGITVVSANSSLFESLARAAQATAMTSAT